MREIIVIGIMGLIAIGAIVIGAQTMNYAHQEFCHYLGYDETPGWSYSEEFLYGKPNYVDCCTLDDCERIYFREPENESCGVKE